jgi:hypothetical protein
VRVGRSKKALDDLNEEVDAMVLDVPVAIADLQVAAVYRGVPVCARMLMSLSSRAGGRGG